MESELTEYTILWVAGFPILILLHKSKVEHTDKITRLLFTFIIHTNIYTFLSHFLTCKHTNYNNLFNKLL